ncbi:MAG: hypothetical protein C0197_04380 [Caldimicrobium thiodismutans]|uniref:Uncharacterized protein n=1 Tax=Caldimicrobium thiodismutans TaxID=1653476 RepID=A0A2N7PJ88_9BACT|nr:MAG: hypothetical protein C0197_04380 [Caldimicrobium thiodismutans]
MKKFILFSIFLLLAITIPLYAKEIDLGVSISDGKIRSFYFALVDYFRVPEEQIIIIKKRYPIIYEEELPVILIIVREAGVDPDVIIELRKRGYSWYDIMVRFRVYPEIVFKRYIVYGPPYGKAWGHHKKKKKIIFVDDDIVALANIKFISEYYREDPQIIIKYKEKYPRFIDVNYEIYESKKGKKHKEFKENYDDKDEIIILDKEKKHKFKEKHKKD